MQGALPTRHYRVTDGFLNYVLALHKQVEACMDGNASGRETRAMLARIPTMVQAVVDQGQVSAPRSRRTK